MLYWWFAFLPQRNEFRCWTTGQPGVRLRGRAFTSRLEAEVDFPVARGLDPRAEKRLQVCTCPPLLLWRLRDPGAERNELTRPRGRMGCCAGGLLFFRSGMNPAADQPGIRLRGRAFRSRLQVAVGFPVARGLDPRAEKRLQVRACLRLLL